MIIVRISATAAASMMGLTGYPMSISVPSRFKISATAAAPFITRSSPSVWVVPQVSYDAIPAVPQLSREMPPRTPHNIFVKPLAGLIHQPGHLYPRVVEAGPLAQISIMGGDQRRDRLTIVAGPEPGAFQGTDHTRSDVFGDP